MIKNKPQFGKWKKKKHIQFSKNIIFLEVIIILKILILPLKTFLEYSVNILLKKRERIFFIRIHKWDIHQIDNFGFVGYLVQILHLGFSSFNCQSAWKERGQ